MSYISAIRKNEDVIIWERHDEGRTERVVRAPHYFYVRDINGTDNTIYGDNVTRYDFDTLAEFRLAVKQCREKGLETFEADIAPELRVLSAEYYNAPSPTLNVTFLDIEVDYNKDVGFSSVENPYAPINSIAMYHQYKNEYVVYAVPPPGQDWSEEQLREAVNEKVPLPDGMKYTISLFPNEKELLMNVLLEIEDSDLLSGWNSDFFDMPYIAKRLEKIGVRYLRMLSFPGASKPEFRQVEKFKTMHTVVDIDGRISLDYLNLFKKYEMAERPSYKLEAIADEILPELPKLHYEGSLAELYTKDFAYFVRYNIRDTEILHGFEERLGYVALANDMVHLSTALFKHVGGTLKLAELATINYCHHELGGLVVNNTKIEENDSQIQGAFVLIPQVGMSEKIGSVDITSLYPSSIRSVNISKETIIGQLQDKVKSFEAIAAGDESEQTLNFDDGKSVTKTAKEWREFFKTRRWAVSGYGTVFDQNKPGIIPMILTDWFATRKKYQKMMTDAKDVGDNMKAAFYNRLQYVFKIKLNSFYGALTNPYFRFYDLRMGESTTGTGRQILLHQCAKVCEILDGTYQLPDEVRWVKDSKGIEREHVGYKKQWSVVYGDTDSTYFTTNTDTDEQAIMVADRVGELVNESFPKFMRETFLCNEGFDEIIKTGREIVSDRGIFVDKKRYILHLINSDGYPVDKMKVMGLDTKKTTLPREVSKVLNTFVERHLKGEEWESIESDIVDYKDLIATTDDIMMIGLPRAVQKVEIYTKKLEEDRTARCPGHVLASIHYNLCLEKYGDRLSMPIISGTKIKVFYTTQPTGRFRSIAIPVDIDQIPEWFLREYQIDRDAHIERLVDNPLGNIIKAIGKDVPTRQGLLVNDLLEF